MLEYFSSKFWSRLCLFYWRVEAKIVVTVGIQSAQTYRDPAHAVNLEVKAVGTG